MIVFDLKCANEHVFEAWFQDTATFEDQAAAGRIACAICGDTAVTKALMAPNVANAKKTGGGRSKKTAARMGQYMTALAELRQQVEKHCDYVGEKFPEEARRIHYGEIEHHNIYGEASDKEVGALKDEGIEFQRVPWAPPKDA